MQQYQADRAGLFGRDAQAHPLESLPSAHDLLAEEPSTVSPSYLCVWHVGLDGRMVNVGHIGATMNNLAGGSLEQC